MQEAVNYGLRVLESAFEHLDIKAGNSDSEDEEVPDKVEAILEPKVGLWSWQQRRCISIGMRLRFVTYLDMHARMWRLPCLAGPVRGQTPPVSDWFQGFHGARWCRPRWPLERRWDSSRVLSTSPFTSWESVHHSHVIVCAEMSVDSDRELESGDDKESDVR